MEISDDEYKGIQGRLDRAKWFYEAVVRMRAAQQSTDQQEQAKAEAIIDNEIERVQAILLRRVKKIAPNLNLDNIV